MLSRFRAVLPNLPRSYTTMSAPTTASLAASIITQGNLVRSLKTKSDASATAAALDELKSLKAQLAKLSVSEGGAPADSNAGGKKKVAKFTLKTPKVSRSHARNDTGSS